MPRNFIHYGLSPFRAEQFKSGNRFTLSNRYPIISTTSSAIGSQNQCLLSLTNVSPPPKRTRYRLRDRASSDINNDSGIKIQAVDWLLKQFMQT